VSHPQTPIKRTDWWHPACLELPDDARGALVLLVYQIDESLHPVAGFGAMTCMSWFRSYSFSSMPCV
jgi:hypothetical protein